MATLNVWNFFQLNALGSVKDGHHGLVTQSPLDPLGLAVDGVTKQVSGSLATATVLKVYDIAQDQPTQIDYIWFWADQACYIQLIGTTSNVILRVLPNTPVALVGFPTVKAAASTTAILGAAEPALEAVQKVVIGNYSGATMSYNFAVFN